MNREHRSCRDIWPGPGPFTVQLTDSVGHQVTVTGISLTPGVVQATGTSMYGAGAPAVAWTSAAPTAAASTARGPAPARTSAGPVPSPAALVPVSAAKLAAASPTPSC